MLVLVASMLLSLFACTDQPVDPEITTTGEESSQETESTEGESTTNGESTTEGESTTLEQTVTGGETTVEGTTTGEENTTEGETTTSGETTTAEGTTTEETTTAEETTTVIINDDEIYENGGKISDAGINWEDDHFALTNTVIDESKAIDISAAELILLLQDKKALTGKEVYRLTDKLVLPADKYYGNGAVIIAEHGVVIENAEKVVIKGLVIKGSISVIGSKDVTLFEVDVRSNGDALVIDDKSNEIYVKKCRFTSSATAIKSDADVVSVFSSYFCADVGLDLNGDDNAVQDCHIVAVKNGVVAKGVDVIVRNNTLEMSVDSAAGIEVLEGSENVLVAMNIIKDVQTSLSITGGYNCSVILNSAIRIVGENNTNLYVIDNNLGGRIVLKNNNYLIADGNKYVKDQKDHTPINSGNGNTNGDTITKVDERAEVGANEDILPHTNKDLFAGMERNAKVTDISNVKTYGLNDYIRENARNSSVVIVPPGAYSVNSTMELTSTHANTTIYAYGVLQELSSYSTAFRIDGSSDIKVQGLAVAYTQQSCGQVHVVEKTGGLIGRTVKVVPSAGYLMEFSMDDKDGVCGNGFLDVYAYDDNKQKTAMYNWTPDSHTSTVINDDGTMTITIKDQQTYNAIKKGDIFTCRLGEGDGNVRIYNSQDIKLKDVTIYGVSTALSIVAETDYLYSSGSVKGIELERVHNTADSGRVIDEATYLKYKEYEEKYGISFELREDDRGNYHGAAARVGTLDATHISACDEGLKITSCIFESMADDGTNHKGMCARLHDIIDNGDGTTTLVYKNNLSSWQFSNRNQTVGNVCKPFQVGETVYVYTNEGEIVCETAVKEVGSKSGAATTFQLYGRTCAYYTYSVKVDTDAINWSALYNEDGTARYDLSDNDCSAKNKVLVDNLSHNSANAVFDNVLVRYVRSRGFLIKTTGVTIKHCTFRDIAGTAIKFSSELTWGESTVPKDALVYKCLFDHVGYDEHNYNNKVNAGISIHNEVGGDKFNANGMNCKNIVIDGCKFTNNENRYAIHIQNAQGITIQNCTFDDNTSDYQGVAVTLSKTLNIKIENNTYNYGNTDDITKLIVSSETKNIYGADVTDADGNALIPDSVQ
jgi:hypothetical protein